MDGDTAFEILGMAERSSMLLHALHGLLVRDGHQEEADIVWVCYLEASHAAQCIGDGLGIEPHTT